MSVGPLTKNFGGPPGKWVGWTPTDDSSQTTPGWEVRIEESLAVLLNASTCWMLSNMSIVLSPAEVISSFLTAKKLRLRKLKPCAEDHT